MEVLSPVGTGVRRAAALLREGAVVAFPTDTVYGLAAVAADALAVRRVYRVKGRRYDLPLVVMASTPLKLTEWVELDERAHAYMRRWWPGPLTIVLFSRPGVAPPLCTGEPPTTAVRIPDHPVARALLTEMAVALATTSANRSGEPPALTAAAVLGLEGVAAVIDAGRAPEGRPSAIVDLTGPSIRLLREGPLPSDQLLLWTI